MDNTIYMERMAIGDNVRNLRKRAYLSQMDLAEKLGVSVMTVYRIENGIGNIKTQNLVRMAEIFEVEIQVILTKGAVKDPKSV